MCVDDIYWKYIILSEIFIHNFLEEIHFHSLEVDQTSSTSCHAHTRHDPQGPLLPNPIDFYSTVLADIYIFQIAMAYSTVSRSMFYDVVLPPEKVIIQRRTASLSCSSGNRPPGCIDWIGCKTKTGHGTMYVIVGERAYQLIIHRLQYYISNGQQPLPVSKQVSHLCHNKLCINPRYL
jgi:hypothetical protein